MHINKWNILISSSARTIWHVFDCWRKWCVWILSKELIICSDSWKSIRKKSYHEIKTFKKIIKWKNKFNLLWNVSGDWRTFGQVGLYFNGIFYHFGNTILDRYFFLIKSMVKWSRFGIILYVLYCYTISTNQIARNFYSS